MIDIENERALAKKTEARADDIFRIVRAEIILACGGELQFMAIMLGEVHAKIGRLLAEVEQKAQADGCRPVETAARGEVREDGCG